MSYELSVLNTLFIYLFNNRTKSMRDNDIFNLRVVLDDI